MKCDNCEILKRQLDRVESINASMNRQERMWLAERDHAVDNAARLKAAIEKHRAQRADDRCIFDDDELYEALGDGIKCDRRVGSKEDMLKNCARFIERRCEAGGWPTYADLEKRIADLEKKIAQSAHSE